MATIKEHLSNLRKETEQLSKHITEANEFVIVDDIRHLIGELEFSIHEAEKVFESTKEIEK